MKKIKVARGYTYRDREHEAVGNMLNANGPGVCFECLTDEDAHRIESTLIRGAISRGIRHRITFAMRGNMLYVINIDAIPSIKVSQGGADVWQARKEEA